ncbi:MAG: succinyldiaminopimelate transaminase [Pseudomonadota bacterium]|nr:MAG: succinyldiaminopimelate transaminase [Pseudomonadota bacterium]
MNPDLDRLQPYPFEKLAALKQSVSPPDRPHIALSIGEPRHPSPAFVAEALTRHLDGLANYPLTRGMAELREGIVTWLTRRFELPGGTLDPQRHVLPVTGTREALFAFAQAVVDRNRSALVLLPNPFYQIYEGAALLAGAQTGFLNTLADSGFIPDFDAVADEIWARCQLLYLCSPGNPSGAVISTETLQRLIELSLRHDFVIASDECYSEIYYDEAAPPVGLLQAAASAGHTDYRNCVVFHSLSKRSNLPGLRSGFVAGEARLIERFLRYRVYHGCAMPLHHQWASLAAWQDEAHVQQNRQRYREKFDAVLGILDDTFDLAAPAGGFYLWPQTPIDDQQFALGLYQTQNVTVLPGSYLSRDAHGCNPGQNRMRMALVGTMDECVDAANRIRSFVESL